jgi:hypothetical protein
VRLPLNHYQRGAALETARMPVHGLCLDILGIPPYAHISNA